MTTNSTDSVSQLTDAGSWSVRSFNGRGSRTPHYTNEPGRVAVCGFNFGSGILSYLGRSYVGDNRCKRCARKVAAMQQAQEQQSDDYAADALSLYGDPTQPARSSSYSASEFGCYSLNLTTGRVCTLDFDHDGDHVAYGPYDVEQTWERAANDRSATEHEKLADPR